MGVEVKRRDHQLIMYYTLFTIVSLYALFTTALAVVWWRMRGGRPQDSAPVRSRPRISVLIPVRNEEAALPLLLEDLRSQTYPMDHFEVIVADDSSTDNTRAIVQSLIPTLPYRLHLLALTDERTASPKKRAIRQSITGATGDLIVTTDGDCRVGPRWLQSLGDCYQQTGAKLISGPVTFTGPDTLFGYLQTVEGSSLIGSGACTMAMGAPTMCNGANLAYEKAVFNEVGGFDGVDHIASGDDELLMHKIASRYPDRIRFLKSGDAIVQTAPQATLRSFYHQRKRWASKWRAYESYLPSVLALFIFASNAALPLSLVLFFTGSLSGPQLTVLVALKAVPEWLFLGSVLLFLRKRSALPWILPTQLVYPFYVVFFGLAAQQKGFQWKGRQLE